MSLVGKFVFLPCCRLPTCMLQPWQPPKTGPPRWCVGHEVDVVLPSAVLMKGSSQLAMARELGTSSLLCCAQVMRLVSWLHTTIGAFSSMPAHMLTALVHHSTGQELYMQQTLYRAGDVSGGTAQLYW